MSGIDPDPGTHWDGRRWLLWDGYRWVPVSDAGPPAPGNAATRPHNGRGPLLVVAGVLVAALAFGAVSVVVATRPEDGRNPVTATAPASVTGATSTSATTGDFVPGTAAHVSVVDGYLESLQDGYPGRAAQYCTPEFAESAAGPYAMAEDRGTLDSYAILSARPDGEAVAVVADESWAEGPVQVTYRVASPGGPLLIESAAPTEPAG